MTARKKSKLPSDNGNRVPIWAAKGDITNSKVYNFWQNHHLVTHHGYKPVEAHEAAQSQHKATLHQLNALYNDTSNWAEDAAIVKFWRSNNRSISQRFHDFATDIAELETDNGWHPNLRAFTGKFFRAGRPSQRKKPASKPRVVSWLIANWVTGEQICHLNARQIGVHMASLGIVTDEESIRKRISELKLVHGKKPKREQGYSAHSK